MGVFRALCATAIASLILKSRALPSDTTLGATNDIWIRHTLKAGSTNVIDSDRRTDRQTTHLRNMYV